MNWEYKEPNRTYRTETVISEIKIHRMALPDYTLQNQKSVSLNTELLIELSLRQKVRLDKNVRGDLCM